MGDRLSANHPGEKVDLTKIWGFGGKVKKQEVEKYEKQIGVV